MEPRWFFVNHVAAVFMIFLFQGVSCDTFYILTATANPCPSPFIWGQCITLQRFATNSPSHGSNVMLILESGSHSLTSGLSLSNIQNFTMVPHTSGDRRPTVTCNTATSSQSFTLTSVSHVVWQEIAFNGCTSVIRSSVDSVSFRDVSFASSGITIEGITNSFQLINVDFTDNLRSRIEGVATSTSIQLINVTFTGERAIELSTAAEITVEESIVQQVSIASLYITQSHKVNIVRCKFLNNRLGDTRLGGGLYLTLLTANITDSIFYNNQALYGAAIATEDVDLTIDGSNFTSNAATSRGAGLTMDSVGSNLTVTNTMFISNTARYGAAIESSRFQIMKIVNCSFSGNHNEAILTSEGGNLLISNSTFHSNSGEEAGALRDRNSINYTISDCSFTLNRVHNGNGGAIVKYDTTLIIRQSIFSGNSASQNGGAIYTSGTLLAEWTNFTDNIAINHGGAIEAQANQGYVIRIYLINCHVTSNTGRGGVLHLNGDYTAIYIDSSHFTGNDGTDGSGGAIHHEGRYTNISITDSSFDNNSAASCGVVDIDNTNHQSVLTRSVFSSNIATFAHSSEGGGVICVRSATISLTSCTFNDNHAVLNAGVLNIEDSDVTVDRCSFINNSADLNGGVAYSNTDPTSYSVRLSTFLNNSAGRDGGAFYMGMIRSRVNVSRSSLGSNSAKNSGGMIAINGSQLVIDNQTNVYDNRASLGAAISACGSDVTAPSELTITGDSAACKFYSGSITRYNISDFIRQEFTTIAPATHPTESTPFTNGSSPHSPPQIITSVTNNIAHTSSHKNMTKPTSNYVQGTDQGAQSSSGGYTDYTKIAVVICVPLILIVGLCTLIGVFLGIMIFFMLTKRRRSRNLDRGNDFLLQEDNA